MLLEFSIWSWELPWTGGFKKIYQKALPKNCAKKSVGWSQKVSRLYKTRLGFKKSCFPTILF